MKKVKTFYSGYSPGKSDVDRLDEHINDYIATETEKNRVVSDHQLIALSDRYYISIWTDDVPTYAQGKR